MIPWRTARTLIASGIAIIALSSCNLDADDGTTTGTIPWTWVDGARSIGATGSYATRGTAGGVPGAREAATHWTDASGDFWLFGGLGYDSAGHLGYLNDLWKYAPGTGQWTWVSGASVISASGVYGTLGQATTSTAPGAREATGAWIDAAGNLWLFGGYGYDADGNLDHLNDLWKFSPPSGEWTWVKGSSTANARGTYGTRLVAASANAPGAREYLAAWIDSLGNLWLFGGSGYDSAGETGDLNDLWKYDPSTNEWIWMSGGTTVDAAGVYGAQGNAGAGYTPGGRAGPNYWIDLAGNFWIFGGGGYDSDAALGYLGDLWKYTPSSGLWAWVGGAQTVGAAGSYGTRGVAASGNVPGAREAGASWVDPAGNLWLSGGDGVNSAGSAYYLNDLWKYDSSTGEWTWISGSSSTDASGLYGTEGKSSEDEGPGGRFGPATWIDGSGDLWLFGGQGLDYAGDTGDLNDLWKATP